MYDQERATATYGIFSHLCLCTHIQEIIEPKEGVLVALLDQNI